jgi:cytochrome b subunit of formate dehydrogenase
VVTIFWSGPDYEVSFDDIRKPRACHFNIKITITVVYLSYFDITRTKFFWHQNYKRSFNIAWILLGHAILTFEILSKLLLLLWYHFDITLLSLLQLAH